MSDWDVVSTAPLAAGGDKSPPGAWDVVSHDPVKTKTGYARMLQDQATSPRWDFLGDTGRAASASARGIPEGFNQMSPSPQERAVKHIANREQYGVLGGMAKDFADSEIDTLQGALKIPLSALGVLASPVTGAMHAGLGSALSYLPMVDKKSADDIIDKSMIGIGPEGMEAGLNGPFVAATARTANRSAAANQVNAAARAANPTFSAARDAGYVVHPAEVPGGEDSLAGQFSGLGGKIKTQQEASERNQRVTNRLAAQELGLPPDTTLDEHTFTAVRRHEGQAYQRVEAAAQSLPRGAVIADTAYGQAIDALDTAGHDLRRDFPELGRNPDIEGLQASLRKPEFSPRAGVEAIKRLRFQSKENLKALGDPQRRELGMSQRDAAAAMEDLIERRLTQSGNAQAVADYQAARTQIAKSHDIESVTDSAGNVDARKLAALGNKRPLTGNMRLIANTADRYPKSMQVPSKFGGVERRSILDTITALTGVVTGHPLLTAAVFSRPLARSTALSDALQNRLLGLQQPSNFLPTVGKTLPPAIGRQNALRAMLGPPNPPQTPQQPPNQ